MERRGQREARLRALLRVPLLGARHVEAVDLALRVRLIAHYARTRAQLSGPTVRSRTTQHLPRPAAVQIRPHPGVLRRALSRGEVVEGLLEAQGGL